MKAFELETWHHDHGNDLTALREAWIKVSETKRWPQNEEGWRRYLDRAMTDDTAPKRKGMTKRPRTIVPDAFIAWWQRHRHAGYFVEEKSGKIWWGITPLQSWNCLRYRKEYEESLRVAGECAAP